MRLYRGDCTQAVMAIAEKNVRMQEINDLNIVLIIFLRGTPPSPRSDHAAACHAERYLLIFGGASHATVFNDLHVLDLQTVRVLQL